ncbi:MAG: hypothetical protein IKU30_04840 [Clostridia bacterium]|nr:hypothetical protein [Clostridia bacterium]
MKRKEQPIDTLFTAACCGDIPTLKNYFEHGGVTNRRYNRFRKDHSLIAGALRNNEAPTVFYLIKQGETVEPDEVPELNRFFDTHEIIYDAELKTMIGAGLEI